MTGVDHVAVLEAGRIVEHGTRRDLLAADTAYARTWAPQESGAGTPLRQAGEGDPR